MNHCNLFKIAVINATLIYLMLHYISRMIRKETYSSEETIQLGREFSRILKEKDVIILEGILGGGKTTFTKGILDGFGYRKKVLSPSFILIRQYPVKKFSIYHVDLYRLNQKRDIFNLGIEDYLYAPKSIVLIEWGGKITQFLPYYIKVEFSFLKESSRSISFSSWGYLEIRNWGSEIL